MLALQLFTYLALLVAVIAMLAKALKYLTAPEHLRWELYPVPHEKGRADYGGSYLEELDWWSKPRHSDMLNEIKEMMQEIVFLKGVYHHNKRVWLSSFPFHFGLYLCIGWLGLLLIGAVGERFGLAVAANAAIVGAIIYYLTLISGYAGLILTGIGAAGLLIWRASDKEQRIYSSPVEYINLSLFIITIVVALIVHAFFDPSFVMIRGYVGSLATLSVPIANGLMMTLEIALISLLILYIPISRMSHFVAKYFLYHSVRWNDKPNERGSKMEKRLATLLGEKVDWHASHISTGKSWVEVVKETKSE